MNLVEDRARAVELADEWMRAGAVFLDTETTGLGPDAEMCDLGIVDGSGRILFNSLIKPAMPIPAHVSEVHHITNEMVQYAPTFLDVLPAIDVLLRACSVVVTYNAQYDWSIWVQSARAHKLDANSIIPALRPWECAMTAYSQFYGEWNGRRGDYRWHKLSAAAARCGIEVPDGLHRAVVDADLARLVVMHIAAQS
jgi:DNA polymerase-3 subunit epsilon